ncbi:MAG: hypothetical protein Q7U52_16635 [Hydrogenophaga sp.]|nr:hypothetical protein [Hydrogenophaga sp.]
MQRQLRRTGLDAIARHPPHCGAQDQADPEVLVLPRFAGATDPLQEALLVNLFDTTRTTESIRRARQMPLSERLRIRQEGLHGWRPCFLDALAAVPPKSSMFTGPFQRKERGQLPFLG